MTGLPVSTGKRVAVWTSVDQLLSSLGNALLLFTVAQMATVAEFGAVSLLVAVFAVWMAFNRGALGAPILLVSNLGDRHVRSESGYASTWAALTGVGAAALLCVVGAATGELMVAILFAAALPAVLVQDVLRFAAIALGRPTAAVLSDGLWTMCIGSAFLSNMLGTAIPVVVAVALWGLSGLAAALVLALAVGIAPRFRRIADWWRVYGRARMHFGLGDALSPVYTVAVLFAVTLIVDAAVAGSLRGATTLFGPLALVFAALPLVFVPHARRSVDSADRQWRLLVRISWISSALTAAAAATFVAIPARWGAAIMGDTWDSAVAVIPFEALAVVAAIWMASVNVFLKAQGRSRAAFWTRILQVFAQLTGCVIGALAVGTAVAIAGSGAALLWLTVLTSVLLARRFARTPETGSPAAAAAIAASVGTPTTTNSDQLWPVIDVLEDEMSRSRESSRGTLE